MPPEPAMRPLVYESPTLSVRSVTIAELPEGTLLRQGLASRNHECQLSAARRGSPLIMQQCGEALSLLCSAVPCPACSPEGPAALQDGAADS